MKARNQDEKFELIKKKKQLTSIDTLSFGLPDAFRQYLYYCRNLMFEEKPDYKYLRGLFESLMQENEYEYDGQFDWTPKRQTSTSGYRGSSNGNLQQRASMFRNWKSPSKKVQDQANAAAESAGIGKGPQGKN